MKKAVGVEPDIKARNLRRLRRIEGQVRGLQKMVEEDRYCAEIMTQISSVHEALRAVGRELMRNHLKHCATSAIRQGDANADAMYAKGVEIYCAPTADARNTWLPTMQHVALEGRCFVLSCNQYARRSDYPDTYDSIYGNDPNTTVSRGGSCIIDPFGKFLAGPNYEDEIILIAELDRRLLPKAKFDFDAVGHYSRPDIFRLVVDDQPKLPVSLARENEKPAAKMKPAKAK